MAQEGRKVVALALAEPRTETLKRAPLSLVVCQIRHEHSLAVSDPKRGVAIQEALEADFPSIEEQGSQTVTITAGTLGMQTAPAETSRGWRMRSEDQAWTAVTMPDFFSLETTQYRDWPDFRRRIRSLAEAVDKSVDPALEQRIGLRFINRMTHPDVDGPRGWKVFIDPAFLGPVAHESLGEGVVSTQQLIQLDTANDQSAIIRHGCYRDQEPGGPWAYTLDLDCYVQRGQAFDVGEISAAIEDLHTLALQLFQASITEAFYSYLKG